MSGAVETTTKTFSLKYVSTEEYNDQFGDLDILSAKVEAKRDAWLAEHGKVIVREEVRTDIKVLGVNGRNEEMDQNIHDVLILFMITVWVAK